jgi:hypothetical protein
MPNPVSLGATMSFSKYGVDPVHIEAMRAASHRVCDVLQLDCGTEGLMEEIVFTKIVELAKARELDPAPSVARSSGEVGARCYNRGTRCFLGRIQSRFAESGRGSTGSLQVYLDAPCTRLRSKAIAVPFWL